MQIYTTGQILCLERKNLACVVFLLFSHNIFFSYQNIVIRSKARTPMSYQGRADNS